MNFVTESEVEDAKKKRAEEWQKAREAGREIPEEEPETFRDTRPLYEKLKEQKDRKQEEFEEQLKFKNMIYKGLNEEDATFLADVAQKQAAIDGKRFEDETGELAEFRAAAHKLHSNTASTEEENKDGGVSKVKISPAYKVKVNKSQASLLASSIVRKRKSSCDSTAAVHNDTIKLSKPSDDDGDTEVEVTPVNQLERENSTTETTNVDKGKTTSAEAKTTAPSSLSLLAGYDSDDSSDNEDAT